MENKRGKHLWEHKMIDLKQGYTQYDILLAQMKMTAINRVATT